MNLWVESAELLGLGSRFVCAKPTKARTLLIGFLVLSGAFLQSLPVVAQGDAEPIKEVRGYPPFRNYTPQDYGRQLQSQNWSVTQDEEGIIYVANPDGILVYDAVHWRLIPTERHGFVRTVVTDTAGTVHVGAYGEIGMLQPDTTGTLGYVSLLDEIDPSLRDFGHIWNGASTPRGVVFQARNTIFRWDGTAMQHWQASDSTSFLNAFSVNNSIYVHEQGVGLEKVVGDSLQLVPGGERFADSGIYAVLPYNNGLLVGTESGALFRYVDGTFESFETEASDFLAENELYGGLQLPDGTYALATLRGGVLLMDRQGRMLQVLNREAGLVDDDVKSLFLDRQGGLWLACERGLARVDVLSSLSLYDERNDLTGPGYSLTRHAGQLYVGTSAGMFRLVQGEGADAVLSPQFEPIAGLRAQVFELISTPAGLLAATEKGIYVVEDGRPRLLGNERTAVGLHASRHDSTVVYVGYRDGIGTLRRSDDQWTPGTQLRGFNKEIYFLEEDASGMLWAASANGGLWRFGASGGSWEDPMVQQLASEEQTPRHLYRLTYFNRRLHVVTRTGVTRPVTDETGQITLQPDSVVSQALPADHAPLADIEAAPDGDLWAFTRSAIYWMRRQPDGTYTVSNPLARSPDFGAINWFAERNGVFWLAGEEGILRHAPRRIERSPPRMNALIRRVATVETDSLIFGGTGPKASADASLEGGWKRAILPYEQNALRFEYAAPGFGSENEIEYQYRLQGFDDTWSPWTNEARKDYTNLSPGPYEFQVRARHPRVWESNIASFRFQVLPPWYRTIWAYGGLAAFGIALVAGAVWWRSAHLEARARNLERMVAQRTAEVQEQAKKLTSYNRELRQTNEVLQEALEQKAELLGIAAHDLKNPLFGIRGLSEILLENKDLEESMHRKIDLIYESADETLELINDLLESAAASSGQVRLDVEVMDLEPVAEWVIHSFRQQAEKKGQHIDFSAPEADCRIEADERKLREAMSNLVSNAVKYSPKGAGIEVEIQRTNDEVSFIVRDEGPGLSEEERKNLFAPFQRLSPEPTAGEASSGLGLYIVKQLVELHEGRVWVESEVGRGSTFGITLPAFSTEETPQPARMER